MAWEGHVGADEPRALGVSAVLVALGLTIDAAVKAVPLLLNTLIVAGLEARAEHRLEQLPILSAPTATVIRDDLEPLPIADAIVLALVSGAADRPQSTRSGDARSSRQGRG